MKNGFLTKIGAVLISAAMFVGSMTSVCAEIAAVDATSGYFWLEGEDGAAYGEWDTLADSTCNGEKYRRMATNNAAEGGNRIEYKINVTDSGKYKTYIRSTMAGNEWMSEAKLYIDGAEIALTKASAETWYAPAAVQWFTGAEVQLDDGEHTVVYKLEAPRSHGNDTYVGALDSIAIMPVDYNMNAGVGERPSSPEYLQPTDGYFWLEGESGICSGTWGTASNGAFSNGKWKYAVSTENPKDGWTIKYFIDVPKTGEYTAYLLGSSLSNVWAAPTNLYIDDTPVELTASSGDLGWDNQVPYAWNKATVQIKGGKHSVTYKMERVRSGDNTYYCGGLDFITIMPSDYTMAQDINARPVAPKTYASNWFEETDAISKSGVYYSVSGSALSGGTALQTSTASAPGADGYNVDFTTNIKNAGEYDIYYRSNIPQEWMSKPDLFVDGVKQSGAKVTDEGWFGQLTLGWNKATVSLAKGEHTIRWTLIDSRTASTNNWIGMFDCMAILPKDMPFAITGGSIAYTKIDYELCAAAADINLKSVTGDIVLPSETESGIEITWTSSDPEIISEDGKVTRGAEDKEVRLTAATPDDYEKTFTLTVKKLADFDVESFYIMGNVAAGETISANAELKCGLEDSKKAMIIIALYTKDGEMIAANIDSKNITAEGTTLNAGLTVPADIAEGTYATAYLWNDIDDLKPIMPAIRRNASSSNVVLEKKTME